MLTVVFLVCNLNTKECMTLTEPKEFFDNTENCQSYAENLILSQQDRVVKGELPPFVADYQCISWDKA
jgi:hypothetical protein